MRYKNFIKIDPKFYSVFNKEVDENNPELWKTFIPHQGFLDFLNKTINSLNRQTTRDTKSIWLYGSYGTGKTFAVFVLKHLLEDDEEDVEEYFESNHQTLALFKDKIRGLRKDGVLVIYKSSAGHINTSVKLNLEIMNSIYEAFSQFKSKKNLESELLSHDYELLISVVNESTIDWDKFIPKYRTQLFFIRSKEEILSRLKNKDFLFATNLIDCLKEEGFSYFRVNDVNEVKEWIEELLNKGFFSKILFIWDEFSDFFTENAPIFSFQELAHLTHKIPFYFLIVTHRPADFWENRFGEDLRKLKDRFINIHFTMENITMYKLIGHVIKPFDYSSWSDFKEESFKRISPKLSPEIDKLMSLDTNLKPDDIKNVFPIHPFSVYLITKIVEYFGSTNRTVFDFMKSDKGFVKFIDEYPKNDEYLLTSDFLWDFFFVENSEILTFYPKVRKWINYWHTHYEKVENEEERKVFKAICLLFTLKEEILILKPSYKTLRLAFSGTSILKNLYSILEKLDRFRIIKLYTLLSGEVEILEPTLDLNQEKLEKIKSELPSFSEFVKNYISKDEFKIHRRTKIYIITDEEIKVNKIPLLDKMNHEIPVFLVLTKENTESKKMKDRIRELSKLYKNCLFLLSLRDFREDDFDKIKEEMAYSEYYKELNQYNQARYHENNFRDILNSYYQKFKNGDFFAVITYEDDGDLEKTCSNIHGVELLMKEEIIPKIFPYSLEEKISSEPLWKNKNLNKKAIEYAFEPVRADKSFSSLINELIHGGFLDSKKQIIDSSFDRNIEHPIIKINEKVKKMLSEQGEINLRNLWEELNNPPFGIYDVPVGVFCSAFVLRNFSKGFYAVDENGYEVELNTAKLKEIIEEVYKGKKNWLIRALSKEQQKFCKFVNLVFNLNTKTPREAVSLLRDKLKRDVKYPLWLANYDDFDTLTDAKKILNLLSQIVLSSFEENIKNLNPFFKNFYKIIGYLSEVETKSLIKEINEILFRINLTFEKFISKYINVDENLNIDVIEGKIRERLQEETYLWKEESLINLLKNMSKEIIAVRRISDLFKISNTNFFEELSNQVQLLIKEGKLGPFWIYKKYIHDENLKILEPLFYKNITYKDIIDNQLVQKISDSINLIGNIINQMVNQKDDFVKKWIKERFHITASSVISQIECEYWQLLYRNPNLSEEQITFELRSGLEKLKENAFKNEILNALERILGEKSFEKFLQNRKIPITILYYLPEAYGSSLNECREFFNSLLTIDRLTGDSLERVKNLIFANESVLRALSKSDVLERILEKFLEDEWDNNIFSQNDYLDFVNFYKNSNIKIDTTEKEILDLFKKWKHDKYSNLLPVIEKTLNSIEPKLLKEVIEDLIKNPEIGFNILKLIRTKQKGI